jgi:ribonuclease HI
VIEDPSGRCVKEGSKHYKRITNNQAEYHALILGLTELRDLDIRQFEIVTDSELLEKQLLGSYRVKSPNILDLFRAAKRLLQGTEWSVRWVRREKNKRADQLAFQAAQKQL